MTMNKNEPLWLPRGSVRALMACFVTGSLVWKLLTVGLTGEEMLLLGGVLGAYQLSKALPTK
jgi:hypothetical protein